MKSHTGKIDRQDGSMLLEALVAILIFSMGVLAIVGMQASAISNSTESKYRSDATLLANKLIGEMWTGDRTPATLHANFDGGHGGTDGPMYTAWVGNATTPGTVQYSLPITNAPAPSVTVDPASGAMQIVVFWKAPTETAAATPHKYTIIAQVR